MGKRKTIGVIIAEPESIYQQRVLRGIFMQCEKYGYNAAVFSSLSKLGLFYKEYQMGETNIFELINFDLLDGIIIPPITLSGDKTVSEHILEKLRNECSKPVVCLDIPYGDYPVVYTDDRSAFSSITAHIIDVHECSKIYFLTGTMGFSVSEQRLSGFTDMMKKRDIPVDDSMIFYGDFWYSGGEKLADKIISGEVERPEAVICASDHMAIGLVNRLAENGIRVPEDIIVTGYDATSEAVLNDITITTCVPDVASAAAKAVNFLREQIEPGEEVIPVSSHKNSGLRICSSCGCPENMAYMKSRLNDSLIRSNPNYGQKGIEDRVDINMLLESYMFENFAGSVDAYDCLDKIFGSDYLIRPYERFWLCLREEWLSSDEQSENGYPEKMRTVIFRRPQNPWEECSEDCYFSENGGEVFDTKLMLPQMWEDRDKPQVFYFASVHYIDCSLGYAVVQCSLTEKHIIGNVFRNWLRNVSSALEMIRVRTRLRMFSERDAMTGLYNRRGMETELEKLLRNAKSSDKLMVFVIDMDGLKIINDTYGHSEGDYGIRAIANIFRQIARNDDICVRAGGDEFYIIGVGDYNSIDALVRVQRFNQALEEANKTAAKPYEISASIGYCCESISHQIAIDELLRIADGRMYENKTARKKQRKE
ncbi:MAG: GGDEF domain-containing protein [Oscillospiraceae bacterium]|nr:GGDEF domain-containing protein [Oscillospiraceae bacterium]